MGSCGSKRRRGPGGPAQDRIDAAGSLLDYDYYGGGLSSGMANRQSFGYSNSGLGPGIANRQSLLGSTGYGSSCPQGVNQNTALLATAAAIAVGAGVIFRAITLQQAGRRRRRDAGVEGGDLQNMVLDLFQQGEQSRGEVRCIQPSWLQVVLQPSKILAPILPPCSADIRGGMMI